MRLIDDWRRAWRFLSVQASGVALVMWSVWMTFPADQQAGLLSLLGLDPGRWIPAVGLVGAIIGRLLRQPELHTEQPAPAQVNPGV